MRIGTKGRTLASGGSILLQRRKLVEARRGESLLSRSLSSGYLSASKVGCSVTRIDIT